MENEKMKDLEKTFREFENQISEFCDEHGITQEDLGIYKVHVNVGKIPMKCPNCGTENVNEMLVNYDSVKTQEDTTTLSKFLYYLEHPDTFPEKFVKVNGYCCSNCPGDLKEENLKVGERIQSREYGI